MFTFTEPENCFENYRIVCKSWKKIIEQNLKFNQFPKNQKLKEIFSCLRQEKKIPIFYEKYLQSFKKLNLHSWILPENCDLIFEFFLHNMKNL